MTKKIHVATNVKDAHLIETRRQQIITSAVQLFREKGFHRTTTREIAALAGFSIGTLYEYIRSKEDVLYLVCDSIFNEVVETIADFPEGINALDTLKQAINLYYRLIDTMHEEFTIMYQETKSLPKPKMQYILSKELEMVAIFEELLKNCRSEQQSTLTDEVIYIAAHQIVVQGQSWAFRKWALSKRFTIDQYIEYETKLLLDGILTSFEN
jgi:AcrR family transcriptional regulator